MKQIEFQKAIWGESVNTVIADAQKEAIKQQAIIYFDFNGIKVNVRPDTNADLLYRDYSNAHLMEWKEIGLNLLPEYPQSVQEELERRSKERDARHEQWRIEAQQEAERKNNVIATKTAGVELEISDAQTWTKGRENNKDGYGNAIYDYAETWGKLMQAEIATGKTIAEVANQTSIEADIEGITGFMYGAAVSMLAHCWKHGEELRIWHNANYGHTGSGTINPAIITVEA